MSDKPIEFSIVIAREGKWFVASCPLLDIATQGRTEKEVKENMEELIIDYFNDPDTQKPKLEAIRSVFLTSVPIIVSESVFHNQIKRIAAR